MLVVVVIGFVLHLALLTKLEATNVHWERQASIICTATSTYAGIKTWTPVFEGVHDTRVD